MPRGPLFAIGGAEDKLRKRTILREFVAACGGEQARIALIPTASSLEDEVVDVYDALFRKLGADNVIAVRPANRQDAHDPALADVVRRASGVFMTGGNQLKLSATICGTPLGQSIKTAHEGGTVVAGTSAGASIQSSHMVAFGVAGATPKQRMTQVAAGLGLLESAVIDQHFDQRNRYGRLLMIVSQSPQLLGIGVDEDTAAIITHEAEHEVLRVLGRGCVTIFDPANLITSAYDAPRSSPLLSSGVVLHVLPSGATFDLGNRRLIGHQPPDPKYAAAETLSPSLDIRSLARDIAAADASPSALRRRQARARAQATRTASRSTPPNPLSPIRTEPRHE
jgi:cyanophycinase